MLAKKIPSLTAPDRVSAIGETVASLKLVGLLSDIKDDNNALTALAELVQTTHFKAGHNIIAEGAEGSEMFILVKGTASVIKSTPGGESYKVAILNGEKRLAFGEGGLIGAEKRGASICADTACDCLIINRDDFEKFALEHPACALPIYRRIAQSIMVRLRKTNEDMLLLYNALVAEIRGS